MGRVVYRANGCSFSVRMAQNEHNTRGHARSTLPQPAAQQRQQLWPTSVAPLLEAALVALFCFILFVGYLPSQSGIGTDRAKRIP